MARPWLLALAAALVICAAACSTPEPEQQHHQITTRQAGWVIDKPSAVASSVPTPSSPNIIFVLTDDLSWNLVKYMPNLRAMQRDGVTFDHYFVSDSFCCPSRASIFTGDLPHNTHVFTNSGSDGGFDAFLANHDEDKAFAPALQRHGYQTAFYGKYLNLYHPQVAYAGQRPWIAPGWSAWGAPGTSGYDEFNYLMALGQSVVKYGKQPAEYLTNVIGNKAMRFIATSAAAHQPFMTEIATYAPHSPYTPAPRDEDRFTDLQAPRTPAYGHAVTDAPAWLSTIAPLTEENRDSLDSVFVRRVQCVQAVDRMIGKLRAELRALDIQQNTYVVFSSDNGLHLGEYNLHPGKQTAFDTDIRVPLIVTGPGIAAGTTASQMTENIDLAPTFESLAGLTPRSNVDGHSLVPLLHGTPPADWPGAVLVEHHGPLEVPSDPDYQPYPSGNPPSYEAIRTARYLYVEYADGEHEVYDLQQDPFELHNVYASIPLGRWLKLAGTLNRMRTCHGSAACWDARHVRLGP